MLDYHWTPLANVVFVSLCLVIPPRNNKNFEVDGISLLFNLMCFPRIEKDFFVLMFRESGLKTDWISRSALRLVWVCAAVNGVRLNWNPVILEVSLSWHRLLPDPARYASVSLDLSVKVASRSRSAGKRSANGQTTERQSWLKKRKMAYAA